MIEKSLRDSKFEKQKEELRKKDKRKNTIGSSLREVDIKRKLIIRDSKQD